MASERTHRRIDILLDQAEEAITDEAWQTVASRARSVLALDPNNVDAANFLAAADRAAGETSNTAPSLQETTSSEPPTTAASADAERRQLTVMFCDLQGSTALSQQLDPEVLRDVIRSYQEVCAGAIGRFEGHIAKYLGDGLLVYFGYPQAHEDDPQRAVRAGLAILQDMNPLNTRLKSDKDLELTVRIGIHTGLVVAGEMGGGDTLEELAIVGETPNIAARIEGAAEPNRVAISDVTANLVQGFFLCETMGPHELKGISEPVELFRVLQESGARTRFDVAVSAQLTPLVGRQQEVGLLFDRWEQVQEGLGQVVLISGEAGIGKSRLLQGIYDGLEEKPHWLLVHQCSPYHQNSPLFPIIESLERWMGFQNDDSSVERLNLLEEQAEEYSIQNSEFVPLFAGLLSVPLDNRYPDLNLSPQRQRQRTMELLVQLLVETAAERPVLVVYEDLHWADPTTLEYLGLLVEQVATSKVMAIFTFRPEFTPPWGSRSHVTQITLNRLPQRLATDMIARITGGKEFPEEVVTQIASKSDGVPLFVEELTQMVLESGLLHEVDGRYELTGPLQDLAIPSTLQDSLTARLDRLGEVKEVVQLASVLGREFIFQLIQAVSQQDEAPLSDHLRQLVTGEFLYQQGIAPEARYIFKHALIQDAAYNSLLISRRQQYHQMVAQVYEESFPETIETQPELVAHHYTEAGLNQQAIVYWRKAGQIAMRRSANVEAVNHLTKGLELLATLPGAGEQESQEAVLQTMLGQSLIQTRGFGAAEVEQAFSRARELLEQSGERSQYFPVMYGLFLFYQIRGDFRSALEVAEQSLAEGQRTKDASAVVNSHRNVGQIKLFSGELTSAQSHLVNAISRQDIEIHRSLALSYGQEPTAAALIYSAITLMMLGYSDQASDQIREALALAREVAHPFSLAQVEFFTAYYYMFSRSFELSLDYCQELVDLSKSQDFSFWLVYGGLNQGCCWVHTGQTSDAIARLQEGLATRAKMGSKIGVPTYLIFLAEAHMISGNPHDGLNTIAQAFVMIEESGERIVEAECHRTKGELLIRLEAESEAEESFIKSLEIAGSQSARLWELRTSMSLARLWQKQGKQTEARELLAEIYGWFTEGFDTPDLVDAKSLLEELS